MVLSFFGKKHAEWQNETVYDPLVFFWPQKVVGRGCVPVAASQRPQASAPLSASAPTGLYIKTIHDIAHDIGRNGIIAALHKSLRIYLIADIRQLPEDIEAQNLHRPLLLPAQTLFQRSVPHPVRGVHRGIVKSVPAVHHEVGIQVYTPRIWGRRR